MRVVVAHNAVPEDAGPDDRDVLVQAAAVAAALRALGHEADILACSLDLESVRRRLEQIAPTMVFNLVEALSGSGRLIHIFPYLLETLGVSFSGCSAEALLMTSNKLLAKERLRAGGLPTPEWVAAGRAMAPWPSAATGQWIVKSVWEHASLGIDAEALVSADSPDALTGVLSRREQRRGGSWFAERFVAGREFNLSLLARPGKGPEILPPAEIRFDDFPPGKARIVDFRAKWEEDSFEYHHTPRCFDFSDADLPLLAQLSELADRCWALFDLRGYARVDFRVDAAGLPFVLEVNANPCLAPDAGFAAAAQRAGLTYTDLVQRVLDDLPTPAAPFPATRSPIRAIPSPKLPETIAGQEASTGPPIIFRRQVLPSDRQGVRRIVHATRFFNPAETDVAVELVEETLTRGEASGYHFLFVERERELAGYACFGSIPCTAASFDLYWIAVDPCMQGRGLGRELMARTETLVREAGGKRLYIETSHRPQYAATRAFYERCGFQLAALIEDFYAPGDGRATYQKVLG